LFDGDIVHTRQVEDNPAPGGICSLKLAGNRAIEVNDQAGFEGVAAESDRQKLAGQSV